MPAMVVGEIKEMWSESITGQVSATPIGLVICLVMLVLLFADQSFAKGCAFSDIA
jgi:hypothetical protein